MNNQVCCSISRDATNDNGEWLAAYASADAVQSDGVDWVKCEGWRQDGHFAWGSAGRWLQCLSCIEEKHFITQSPPRHR